MYRLASTLLDIAGLSSTDFISLPVSFRPCQIKKKKNIPPKRLKAKMGPLIVLKHRGVMILCRYFIPSAKGDQRPHFYFFMQMKCTLYCTCVSVLEWAIKEFWGFKVTYFFCRISCFKATFFF